MFSNPSLITRIGVGKLVGSVIGLIGFVALPWIWPEADMLIRWGILLWYTTFGAIIGVFGAFTRHPILKLPMPWFVRAPFIGAWMNFVLAFFAYDKMEAMLVSLFGALNLGDVGWMTSPFWFALEGAIAGLLIGWLATRFGGEGLAAVEADAA